MNIRVEGSESVEERSLIHRINEEAFGGPDEATLVGKLRADGHALVSLVAELESGIVGHILFSRMWLKNRTSALVSAVALAPISVLPAHPRRGTGGKLIR